MRRPIIIIWLLVFMLRLTAAEPRVVARENMLKDQAWMDEYQKYTPDQALLDGLKARIGSNLKVDVYFAFWCDDSKNNVPRFIRILDSLGTSELQVTFYEVDRKANSEIKYYEDSLRIERVPTFVFFRGGKEIGRIIENPKRDMTEDFLTVVF